MVDAKSTNGKAVVIGAGTMGGGIAAQLANAGWQVWLLDVPGPDPNDKKTRNQAANTGLERVLKNRPPLLFLPEFAARIHVGNTADDLDQMRDADWVVEAVAEKMAIKKQVMAQIQASAGPETVISSNTSGLSLAEMTRDCDPAFRARFLGTHFLNPPRYLKLLEVIPLPETDPAVTEGFIGFAEQVLGHRCVIAKDTPGFISTRIWILLLLDTIQMVLVSNMSVEETDYLTGPLIGRPKSATFRMADLVGLDIIADIAKNQAAALPDGVERAILQPLPDELTQLIADGRLGSKNGAGFYKREGSEIQALDLRTREYRPQQPVRIEEVEAVLALPIVERIRATRPRSQSGIWSYFLWELLIVMNDYLEEMGPQIADNVLAIDRVMRWGFGWELGPFEIADTLRDGMPSLKTVLGAQNYVGSGADRRYRVFGKQELEPMPQEPEYICLTELKVAGKTIRETEEAALIDLGDGVACLEFHTKMNTFSPALSAFVTEAREQAEREFAALVIGNQGPHFSAGFNLNLFLDAMSKGDWNAIDRMLHDVQYAFMGLKYAKIPVVAAPHGYTLGAGCECTLHCAAAQAAPELYMGLPERNVGVIPAGGGTKEMLARAMADWDRESDPFSHIERVFDLIAFPKNSGSAVEAQKMGFLRPGDGISRNADRLLYEAKERALGLANAGYQPPVQQSIWVLGEETLARLRMKIHWQFRAGAITEHDRLIADRVAYIVSGGNRPYAQEVSEDYLLQLEREVFLELAHTPQSEARMRHVLATGKPLKN